MCLYAGAPGFALDDAINRPEYSSVKEALAADDVPRAKSLLEGMLEKDPGSDEAVFLLSEIDFTIGDTDAALKRLTSRLQGKKEDVPFLNRMWDIYMSLYIYGPGTKTTAGLQLLEYRPEEYVKEYKRKSMELAKKTVEKAGEYDEKNPGVLIRRARTLLSEGRREEALAAFERLYTMDPARADVARFMGGIYTKLGRPGKGAEFFEKAVRLDPKGAQTYGELMNYYYGRRDRRKGMENEKKLIFYSAIPSYMDLAYDEKLLPYLMAFFPVLSEKDVERRGKAIESAGQKRMAELEKEPDEITLPVLAAICYSRRCHGDIEDRAFMMMEKRGPAAVPYLIGLMENGRSARTLGPSAMALARIGDGRAFEPIVGKLLMDKNSSQVMDIAGALAELGDERAIPCLAKVALEEEAPPPESGKEDGELEAFYRFREAEGKRMARGRAVLALGRFNSSAAIDVLKKAYGTEELKFYSALALYRATGGAEYKKLIDEVTAKGASGSSGELVSRYLGKTK